MIKTTNFLYPQAFKDISKAISFEWRKNFRIIMWLAPLMIPVSFLIHIYLNVFDFTLIFVGLTIFIYGEKVLLENAIFKKQSRLLIQNFNSDEVTYVVKFEDDVINVEYNDSTEGLKVNKIPYNKIKRVVESMYYYNIIGVKGYLLPIDKKGLSNTTKKELFELSKVKKIPIYTKKGKKVFKNGKNCT